MDDKTKPSGQKTYTKPMTHVFVVTLFDSKSRESWQFLLGNLPTKATSSLSRRITNKVEKPCPTKNLDVLYAFIFIESNTYEKLCFSFNILMNDVTEPFCLTSFSSQNHNPSAQVTCMVVKRLSECCHFPPFSQALMVAAKVIIFS